MVKSFTSGLLIIAGLVFFILYPFLDEPKPVGDPQRFSEYFTPCLVALCTVGIGLLLGKDSEK